MFHSFVHNDRSAANRKKAIAAERRSVRQTKKKHSRIVLSGVFAAFGHRFGLLVAFLGHLPVNALNWLLVKALERYTRFQQRHRVLSHLLFWLAVLLLATITDSYGQQTLFSLNRLLYHSLTLITQILSAYFLAYVIIPLFLYQGRRWQAALCFISGMYILCGLARTINVFVYEPAAGLGHEQAETLQSLWTNLPRLLNVYFSRNLSLALVFLFFRLLNDQYRAAQHTAALEKEKAEAELQALKSQMNPHFLLNTLNNIYSLSVLGSTAAAPAIARLADILTRLLYRSHDRIVPLSGEIRLLEDYIALEQLRYDERLQIKLETDINHDILIAPLVLLTITENAFKHGAGNDVGRPLIEIAITVRYGLFQFRVSNPLILNGHDTAAREKIGLANLRRQLELLYPGRHQLAVTQDNGRYCVDLMIETDE